MFGTSTMASSRIYGSTPNLLEYTPYEVDYSAGLELGASNFEISGIPRNKWPYI